eukprot:PLAT1974.1.p1 GENE.PLAT1974.1~~PLAT1974.1.p1  ORF type:complete len:216 (-),score=60.00 PLAT1974.1:105-752(-)
MGQSTVFHAVRTPFSPQAQAGPAAAAMPSYQLWALVSPSMKTAALKDVVSKSARAVINYGGAVRKIGRAGVVPTGYRLVKRSQGITAGNLLYLHVDCEPEVLDHVKRLLSYEDDIYRAMAFKDGSIASQSMLDHLTDFYAASPPRYYRRSAIPSGKSIFKGTGMYERALLQRHGLLRTDLYAGYLRAKLTRYMDAIRENRYDLAAGEAAAESASG